MQVKDRIELIIDDITTEGQGVGHIENMAVFVDGGVPGDVLEVEIWQKKKNYCVATLKSIIHPSPDRIEPDCPYAGKCGGCQLRHIRPEAQEAVKEKIVANALKHIGGFEHLEIKPILSMDNPLRYRNKAQYKLSQHGVGFYAKGTHDVIPITDCLTQPESCQALIQVIGGIVKGGLVSIYDEKKHRGALRGVVQRTNQKGENMLILVSNQNKLPNTRAIVNLLCEKVPNVKSIYLNINQTRGNTVLGRENRLLYGDTQLTETIGERSYLISPNSFFQVNSVQTEVLYDIAKNMASLTGTEIVFDLYCGTGTIGLYMADQIKKLYGVEIVPEAIEDAKKNAVLNHVDNATFIVGKAEDEAKKLAEQGVRPDVIILDPPRKGCAPSLITTIQSLETPRIVYVSCNPATLARDLKALSGVGYQVEIVQPVDLFPGTGHVETVVLLGRKSQ